jgi:hypothetical protein
MNLSDVVDGLAEGIALADRRRPIAVGLRSGKEYTAGIGPHTEAQTLDLALKELTGRPEWREVGREVPYPGSPRARCDICFGIEPHWSLYCEVKMLRLMGDNGKPNDNMLMHILSPYPQHRSALTDCEKLVTSTLAGRKAILIFGYDYPALAMDPALDAFETLARTRVTLSARQSARFLCDAHPVHQSGRVVGWEIASLGDGFSSTQV